MPLHNKTACTQNAYPHTHAHVLQAEKHTFFKMNACIAQWHMSEIWVCFDVCRCGGCYVVRGEDFDQLICKVRRCFMKFYGQAFCNDSVWLAE